MARKYVLIVPDARDKVDLPTLFATLDTVRARLATHYGGWSEYQGQGGWRDEDGKLHIETHTRFEVYDPRPGPHSLDYMTVTAHVVRDQLQQECVLLAVEGGHTVYFI